MNEHVAEDGKPYRFSKDFQPKGKNGRKPSKLKRFMKMNNLGIEDICRIFQNIVTEYSIDQIKKFVKEGKDDKGRPLTNLVWGLCLAWIADCKRGLSGGGVFSQILDRAYGSVKKEVEISGSMDPVQSMTPEERKAYLAELIRRKNERDDPGAACTVVNETDPLVGSSAAK